MMLPRLSKGRRKDQDAKLVGSQEDRLTEREFGWQVESLIADRNSHHPFAF